MPSTMNSITRDPLLAIAKGLLWFLMATMAIAVAACLVAIPLLLFFQNDISVELAREMPLVTPQFFWAVSGILVFAAILCGVLFRIFQLLKRIVGTVGEGDPFVPDNARRLTQMAWLSLVVQLIGLPLSGLGAWVNRIGEGHTDLEGMGGISGNGLLLMLILFILARVFRKGSEMRAELEGTV
ncbi:DUF2975 domain-containing protein [Novosphingobium aerophilum]|uniref:DUF2975 domain-containing protein n=1 Tax=Novosphingobium TaxID=165696 RepID=UPI001852C59A|nr:MULTISPECIES: DUF2975 domain-containing protein [unclassified Novosphingobium]WRT93440.1 DUF2975 domain-containing protein [Novosphingobium sp. RL4]